MSCDKIGLSAPDLANFDGSEFELQKISKCPALRNFERARIGKHVPKCHGRTIRATLETLLRIRLSHPPSVLALVRECSDWGVTRYYVAACCVSSVSLVIRDNC